MAEQYSPQRHYERILSLLRQSRHAEAEEELRRYLRHAPEDPMAHARLAFCIERNDLELSEKDQKRTDEMLREAETAVVLDPKNSYCHYIFAFCLDTAERFHLSLHEVSIALELDPEDPWHHYQKGWTLYRMSRFRDARIAFLDALRFNPEHVDSLRLLSNIETQLGNPEKAIFYAEAAIRVAPDNSDAVTIKAYAMMDNRSHEETAQIFLEAIRLNPRNELARQGLAQILAARRFLPVYGRYFRMGISLYALGFSGILLFISSLSGLILGFTTDALGVTGELVEALFCLLCVLGILVSGFLFLGMALNHDWAEMLPFNRDRPLFAYRPSDYLLTPLIVLSFPTWVLSLSFIPANNDSWSACYCFAACPLLFFSLSSALIFRSKKIRCFSLIVFLTTLFLTFVSMIAEWRMIFIAIPLFFLFFSVSEVLTRKMFSINITHTRISQP